MFGLLNLLNAFWLVKLVHMTREKPQQRQQQQLCSNGGSTAKAPLPQSAAGTKCAGQAAAPRHPVALTAYGGSRPAKTD